MFSSGVILYAGQSLGLIVARTQSQAINAARLVRVTYKDLQKPILTIKEALLDSGRTKVHTAFGPPNVFDADNVEGIMRISLSYMMVGYSYLGYFLRSLHYNA